MELGLRSSRGFHARGLDRGTAMSLFETLIRGLPDGAALVLNLGESEPFGSRFVATDPLANDRAMEHLLDGQQRLTACAKVVYSIAGAVE